MKLVLIESSGKKETIEKYLGKQYKVIATKGHVRDLPVRKLGVDLKDKFKPDYVILSDKKKLVQTLKEEAKKAEEVLFATDPDREGEAIAWHLSSILGHDLSEKSRIEFNEISKKAISKALENPRQINIDLVDAQQARRVLDRIVGYKLSPFLCDKIQSRLSAGRVQSVTLRLVVERDREIESFKAEEYWTLAVFLDADSTRGKERVKTMLVIDKKKKISNENEMNKILDEIKNQKFEITNIKRAESKSRASAPFITSTLEQDALNKLGFSLKQTSAIAQTLYEGVTIPGEGKVALITYIRTDSVRVSSDAQQSALKYIRERFGEKYAPKTPNFYKSKKDIQDAHEAIRPITLEREPEELKKVLDKNQYRLYKLIYDRFLASQMSEAVFNTMTIDIKAGKHNFRSMGKSLVFDGYTILYNNIIDENDEEIAKISNIEVGDTLTVVELKPEQKFTKPPARFTEASLVKAMEERGIGRPATYTPTITILFSRFYVEKDGKYLRSTELGRTVVDTLVKFFSDIMDVGFTAEMEDKLDDIEVGGKEWYKVVDDFYKNFSKELKVAQSDREKVEMEVQESDQICEKCGARMIIKMGRFGKFIACPNYPECKNTKPISEVVAKCPKCGGDVIRRKSKKNKVFYGCSNYPKCDFISWDIPYEKKCPKCTSDMIIKDYASIKIIKCTKCKYQKKVQKTQSVQETDENEE